MRIDSLFVDSDPSATPALHDSTTHRRRLGERDFAVFGVEFASTQECPGGLIQEVMCDALTAVRAGDEDARNSEGCGKGSWVQIKGCSRVDVDGDELRIRGRGLRGSDGHRSGDVLSYDDTNDRFSGGNGRREKEEVGL
jgi:hypothetical protein